MRVVWWVASVLCLVQNARADIIYLSPKGAGEAARIEAQISPAKVERTGAKTFVRGRVTQSHPTPPLGHFAVTLQPSWLAGDKLVYGTKRVTLDKSQIAYIVHEADSHLDLQVLLSSRDAINPAARGAERTVAPIGSPAWRARLGRILDPNGPTEPVAETAALVHRGSLMFDLIEEPRPHYPADPSARAAYQKYIDAATKRQMDRIKAGGVDIFHPSLHRGAVDATLRRLIEGAAAAQRYGHADKDDPTYDVSLLRRTPGPGEAKDFVERVIIVGAYLCALRETPRTGKRQRCPVGSPCVPEPLLDTTGARLASEMGWVISSLHTHMEVALRSPTPAGDPAALFIEPAERGVIALRIHQACKPRLGSDMRPYVAMLTEAAGDLPATATTAQRTFRAEVRKELIATLRANPDEARRSFATMFFATDPALRAAARSIVVDGPTVHDVIERDIVDQLLAVATQEPATRDSAVETEARFLTRHGAMALLIAVGTLDDPKLAPNTPKHPVAEHVRDRVRRMRKARTDGTASRGETTFLDLLQQSPGELTGPIARRANRFLALLSS